MENKTFQSLLIIGLVAALAWILKKDTIISFAAKGGINLAPVKPQGQISTSGNIAEKVVPNNTSPVKAVDLSQVNDPVGISVNNPIVTIEKKEYQLPPDPVLDNVSKDVVLSSDPLSEYRSNTLSTVNATYDPNGVDKSLKGSAPINSYRDVMTAQEYLKADGYQRFRIAIRTSPTLYASVKNKAASSGVTIEEQLDLQARMLSQR